VTPMAIPAAVVPRAACIRFGHRIGYTDPAVAVATSNAKYFTTVFFGEKCQLELNALL
jgi:hypothetical protein